MKYFLAKPQWTISHPKQKLPNEKIRPHLDLPIVLSRILRMIQTLEIDRNNPNVQTLEKARDVLLNGGLVIVPTETVYGIACDPAVPGTIEKLIAAKGRDGDKPMARLAANKEQVKAASKHWNAGLDALAAKWWPGPLTIVVETSTGWTGYRVPDHAVAIELAKLCGRTLALTSANLSGEPDTKTAQEAMASVEADLALDSGLSAKKAIPSTVIKVDQNKIECLREGRVSFSEIERVFIQGLES
jgi:L-threonylcarbamoyladenylate synthase